MFESIFHEISILLFIAAIIGVLGLLLRQPLIVSFIFVGILAGPSALAIIRPSPYLELLASLGISLLLFIVGLKLDLSLIRTTGKVALMTGLGQVLFTSVIGYWICVALGMPPLSGLYVAIALTFSSTIIIVKLLSDKGELEALHGRIALGFLIVQDIVVVLMMIGLSASGLFGQEQSVFSAVMEVLFKGIVLIGAVALFIRYAAERLLRYLSGTTELMLLFVVAWSVVLASATDYLGFSKELGALMAGISLASTSYRDVLASRLASLRDFLLLFFFINLGSHITLNGIDKQVFQAVLLSLFVLIGNPLIVLAIMGWMGYTSRTGFLAGLTVAQISEFSLVFVSLGLSLGHIQPETVSLVTLVGIITIGLSTYMILYSQRIYERIAKPLTLFERRKTFREQLEHEEDTSGRGDVIVIGLGRYGSAIANRLHQAGIPVLGVDHDPEVVHGAHHGPYPVCYGDINDPDLPESLPLAGVRCVVLSIPTVRSYMLDVDPHMTFIHALRKSGFAGKVILTARTPQDIQRFQNIEVDEIFYPYSDAAAHATERIETLLKG